MIISMAGPNYIYPSVSENLSVPLTLIETAAPIRVDIFDMGDSRNAFGVFTHSRETVERNFGQGSQYFSGLLLYWQDRFFVSILCSPETELSQSAVWHLGRLIESAIADTGRIPELVYRLPQEGLIPGSVKYFKHPIWLNTYHFISDENLLQIEEHSDCVLARYDLGIALIVSYKDNPTARSAFVNFTENYYSDPEYSGEPVPDTHGKWSVSRISGSYIYAVFNATDRESAIKLLLRLGPS